MLIGVNADCWGVFHKCADFEKGEKSMPIGIGYGSEKFAKKLLVGAVGEYWENCLGEKKMPQAELRKYAGKNFQLLKISREFLISARYDASSGEFRIDRGYCTVSKGGNLKRIDEQETLFYNVA